MRARVPSTMAAMDAMAPGRPTGLISHSLAVSQGGAPCFTESQNGHPLFVHLRVRVYLTEYHPATNVNLQATHDIHTNTHTRKHRMAIPRL